jgi:mRNA-degrading endonuclease RelE of RelBE toxin-antitoxin system
LTSYRVVLASSFQRSIKALKKRFPKIKEDVELALTQLEQTPTLGVIIPGGYETRKLRVRNSNLTKGKSSGYRLIYYLQNEPEPILYPLLLYVKSDKADVTAQELKQLLGDLGKEF